MLLSNAVIATMDSFSPYGLINDGTVAIDGKNIAWVGPTNELPEKYKHLDQISLKGSVVTPALIDCHTHLVQEEIGQMSSKCALMGRVMKKWRKRVVE